jgi:hypothetical protein
MNRKEVEKVLWRPETVGVCCTECGWQGILGDCKDTDCPYCFEEDVIEYNTPANRKYSGFDGKMRALEEYLKASGLSWAIEYCDETAQRLVYIDSPETEAMIDAEDAENAQDELK